MIEDMFKKAIHRQSTMLLDTIGIKVDTRTLPSHAAFSAAQKSLYGRNRLDAVWCQHIRPWLMPLKQRKIQAVHRRWQLQFQQELLDEVLRQGQELMADERRW